MQRKIIPDTINHQNLQVATPDESVISAAQTMAMAGISAILVVEKDNHKKLVGFMSSNDLTKHVVAEGKDPATITVDEVMTHDVITIKPNQTAKEALYLMRDKKCRHLPVVDKDELVGVVSIRDLYATLELDLEDDLKQTKEYISHGSSYVRN